MLAQRQSAPPAPHDPDGRVILNGLGWWQLEAMLAIRGDAAGVRIAYREGALELMSPSATHERIKKMIARLLEAYAEETGTILNGYGSLTMKNAPKERAVEPDECYVVGTSGTEPNLAIEVVWTSGGLDKRDIYAALGVRELWEWRDGEISIFALRDGAYTGISRSELLPDLDLDLMLSHVAAEDQTAAVRAFRSALRTRGSRR